MNDMGGAEKPSHETVFALSRDERFQILPIHFIDFIFSNDRKRNVLEWNSNLEIGKIVCRRILRSGSEMMVSVTDATSNLQNCQNVRHK